MSRRRLAIFLVLVMALAVSGCDGHTGVDGRVVDEKGRPIEGATVTLVLQVDDPAYTRSSSDKTGEDGKFSVGYTHAPSNSMRSTFQVNKEGFVPYKEEVVGSNRFEREIVLKPEKE